MKKLVALLFFLGIILYALPFRQQETILPKGELNAAPAPIERKHRTVRDYHGGFLNDEPGSEEVIAIQGKFKVNGFSE